MEKMKGGRAAVAALQALGVDTVFGIPGVHTLEIYDALYDNSQRMRHILCRNEAGAGMLADGYARASGKPGVMTLITGPGLLNAATALAEAYSDSSAVLCICSQNPRPDYGAGRGLLHETRDQLGVASSIVEWAKRATSARQIPELVFEAWQYMLSGRPRPAYLEIPIDVLAEEAVFPDLVPPLLPPRRRPDEALLAEAARMLSHAERPAIIAGAGAAGASADLRTLAAKIGAACVTSVNGKGTFADDSPYHLGSRGRTPRVGKLLERCDVVLVIGSELAPVDFTLPPLSGKVIRVDIDPVELHHNVSPDLPILGDAAEAAHFLARHVQAAPAPALAGRQSAVQNLIAELLPEEERSHAEYGAIQRVLAQALPEGAIVVNDMTGLCYRLSRTAFPTAAPGRFLFPRGYGTLGWSMPAAVGAKLARPDAPVVAIAGDGGFLYTVHELATAVAQRLPLPILVVNNEMYDEIRLAMAPRGKVLGCELTNPDFMDLAKAYKLRGVRISNLERDLPGALHDAFAAAGPTIIEIPVAPAPPR